MSAPDVIVVGGGVIGCAIAHALARARIRVTLLERDAVGAHASSAAAGMLAPYAESGESASFRELGARALACFVREIDELREVSGIDPALQLTGLLAVRRADSAHELEKAAGLDADLGRELVSRRELHARVKGLARDVALGLWSPREGHVDASLLTQALAHAAVRHGATLEAGTPVLELSRRGRRVVGVRTTSGPRLADHVIWATGAWAGHTAAELGAPVPIEPIKGQMIALEPAQGGLPFILWDEAVYLVPRSARELRVGATLERVGFDATPTANGVLQLVSGACALLPALAQSRFLATWAGLRPATPDGLPLLGPVRGLEGVTLAAGHHRNGVLLSLLTADVITRSVLHGERDALLEVCDPARFEGEAAVTER